MIRVLFKEGVDETALRRVNQDPNSLRKLMQGNDHGISREQRAPPVPAA